MPTFTPDTQGTYEFDLVVSDFEFTSPVVSVTLDVPNRAPVASLTGPAEIGNGAEAIYSAAASVDPDGDALSFVYEIITAPAGADPMLMDLGGGTVGFLSETQGAYVLQVTVSDGVANAVQTIDIEVLSGNQAPILGPIAPLYTVELGLELVLDLTGDDPDGDAINFFADPLPLPAGVTLDASTGAVRFRPEVGQEGDYSFAVGVSDGSLTDRDTLSITVVPADAGDTAISGRVLDAVDFANGIETPLAGIPVRLRDAAVMTLTEADGTFSIGSLEAGSEQIFVEPSANGGPGGYSADNRVITVTENQIRDLNPDFLLTPLGDGCAPVLQGVETVLASAVSGVTVTVAADTIQDGTGAAYAGEICLGSLPRLFDQPGLPEETNACQIYALAAPGAIFTAGITVSGPNVDELPEATQLELWRLNSGNGLFRPNASAMVDAGGATVSASAVAFKGPALFTFLPQAPVAIASADMNDGNNRELTPFEGNLPEVYTLPGYRAFNTFQEIGLSYNSVAADPTVIVAGDVTIADTASLPETVQTRIDLSGLSIEDKASWTPRIAVDGTTPALVGEAVTLRQSMPFDATGLSAGRYDYTYYSSASYACSTVSGVYRGELYVQNQTQSPYGQGWAIDELQKLVQRPDGKVAIIDDDSVEVFDPEPTFSEFDEGARLTFQAVGPQGISTADLDGDGDLDVVFGNSGDGTVRTLINLGDREFVEGASVEVEEGNDVPPTGIFFPNIQGALPIDLNGDDLADIAYTAQGSDTLAYLENLGLGAYEKQIAITNFGQLTSIMVDDVDGDGFEDAIFSRFAGFFGIGNTEIYVDYGGESGRFRQRVAVQPFGNSGLQIETGDINGDGLRDIIYRIDDGIQIIINRGNRNYDLFDDDLGGAGTDLLGKYFDVADLNGDGLDDLIATHAPGGVQVFLRNPTGFFFAPEILPFPASLTSGQPYSFLLDVQGDGFQDLILSYGTANGSEVSVYRGNGDGTFQPPEIGLFDYGVANQEAADVDGDGSLDLVTLQRFSVTIDFSKPSADGNLVAGKGEFSTLVALPDGGWERRYKDGNKVIFNADGLQVAEVDTQGNRREFAYDANGALTAVTDQVGGTMQMAYDARGRLATVTYPDGRVTEMEYQDVQLVGITAPDGDQMSFAYDEFGRLNSTINQNGNETVYTHDDTGKTNGLTLPDGSSVRNQVAASLGLVDGLGGAVASPRPYVAPEDRVTTVTDRKGEVSEIVVNSFGSTIQMTDPLGRVTRMERDFNDLVERLERPSDNTPGGVRVDLLSYDGRANITQVAESFGTPAQRVMSYVYEPEFNKIVSMTDGDGFVTSYEYDAFGEVTAVIDPEGGVQRRTYTSRGQLRTLTDERGNVTRINYLSDLNVGEVIYADGSSSTLSYDAQGNVNELTESAGTDVARRILREFDADNRIISLDIVDAAPAGQAPLTLAAFNAAPVVDGVQTYAYDGVGNLTQVIDESGLATTMTYDSLERLVRLDDPSDGPLVRTFNPAGEVIEQVRGDGATQTYDYDAVSRVTRVVDAEGFEKSFVYDVRDNLVQVTDGRGGVTTFDYDGRDRVVQRSNPLNQIMAMSYDRRDNVVSVTREDGGVETATYDDKGRRIEVVTPDNTMRFAYDARDNIILAEDDDSRVTMTYDNRNRPITATTDGTLGVQPAVTLTFSYDALDRRSAVEDSLGGVYGYVFDAEDRLAELRTPWGVDYGMSYDDFGRRTGLTSTTGRLSGMTYENGLLSALNHAQNGVTLTDLTYLYEVDGQLIGAQNLLDPALSKSFAYDALNRLVQVSQGVPVADGGTPIPVEDYAYDQEGNRLSSQLSALYSSDAHNRLLEDDGFTYGYDEKGNRISKTSKVDGATELYAYNSQNRLISYTDANGQETAYHYDALDRRIAKVQGRNATAFIYDFSKDEMLMHDDILLEFAVVGPEDNTGGGGGDPAFASCNAQFALAGIPIRDIFGSDFPLPGLTNELIDQFGGPDALMTFDLLVAAGAEGFQLNETLEFLFRGDVPAACSELIGGGPGGPGGGPGEPDPIQAAACDLALQRDGITRDALLTTGFPVSDILQTRLEGPEGSTAMTVGFLFDEGFPLFIVPDFFEVSPPECFGLDGDFEGPLGIAPLNADAAPQAAASFTSEEAESVTLVRRWAHTTMVDEPIGFEAYADDATPGAGIAHEVYADRLGSIIAVVDTTTGAVVATYSYDAFGNRTTVGDLDQPYGFTGREHDGESGLIYYRKRHLDPSIGRFVQSDPVEFRAGDLNIYSYVQNDPLNLKDPEGLAPTAEKSFLSAGNAVMPLRSTTSISSGIMARSSLIQGQLAGTGRWLKIVGDARRAHNASKGRAAENRVAQLFRDGLREVNYTINGRKRRGDIIDETLGIYAEVKNVAYQAFTRQLKDAIAHANSQGLQFQLFVRRFGGTKLSKPLEDALANAENIVIRMIPGGPL
ncbi:FG-GAP-like repeat-containing protein [uncultured Tateyamaria sp.]|uniref:FG-GAP-like repeat-containing protein n=1 Tax=Tateyamaria sp. 1078 TaxID=3417464 RepID=UPI00262A4B25|nr:FG-GAP-like repeat-containing protein [uncultured Tateyamaria sp.]